MIPPVHSKAVHVLWGLRGILRMMQPLPALLWGAGASCLCCGQFLRTVSLDFFFINFSGSAVKNPPHCRRTWVRSPGWDDPLEKEMAAHSSILAWEIPWKVESEVARVT